MFMQETLNKELVKKLEKEQEEYISKLKEQGIDAVVKNAYEIAIKQEIIDYVSNRNVNPSYIESILKTNNVVERLYNEWMKADGNFYEALEYPVDRELERISNDFYSKDDKDVEQENKSHKRLDKSFER